MSSGISIIVCTYNPDEQIFKRVLTALAKAVSTANNNVECILIDNNSNVTLSAEDYVQQFLKLTGSSKLVIEKKQGLTQARIRGIKEAQFDHILFVDDDNELAADYLVQCIRLKEQYPFIAAFNAGIIAVEYIGQVDAWFQKKGLEHFQSSDIPFTVWGNDSSSYRHWPFGTGMLVKKEVCNRYLEKVEAGVFTLTDRKGTVLTSGGDGQLVSCAIEMGYGIGRARELSLRHLIAARKATIHYLTKMDYGIYYSNEWFLKECFPASLRFISGTKAVKLFIFSTLRAGIAATRQFDFKSFSIQLAALAGRISGNREANGKSIPFWLKWFTKRYQ